MYPGAASIDCDHCHKFVYNLTTGKVATYEAGEDGELLPLPREGPPPCYACPKQSPQRGKELELSEKNLRLLDMYHRSKMPGYVVPKHIAACHVAAHNWHLIELITESAKAEAKASAMQSAYDQAAGDD